MWGLLFNFLGGPLLNNLVKAYQARLTAQNADNAQAVTLAVQEIQGEIAARQTEATIIRQEQGWWVTALPRPLLGFIFVFWLGKVVVWDGCFGWGSTPPLGSEADWAMRIVLTGYFGGRTIEKVARIFKR